MKKRLVLVAFVLCVPALWAADGVIEINQAAVEANGGFPYVISEPGSYILTGNLIVPDENTTAIEIEEGVGSATIDLNGFAIIGPVVCTVNQSLELDCSGSGEGVGVRQQGVIRSTNFLNNSTSMEAVTVRNGTIRGMGDDGIVIVGAGLVERVAALSNGGSGIVANGTITHCDIQRNRGHGINALGGVVAYNKIEANGGHGIRALFGAGAVIEGNQVAGNSRTSDDGAGIYCDRCAVIDNVITQQERALRIAGGGYAGNTILGTITGGKPTGCNLILGDDAVCPPAPSPTQ